MTHLLDTNVCIAAMRGTPYDLRLCGQAYSLDGTLITHNTREFKRVNHLKIEDWKTEEG